MAVTVSKLQSDSYLIHWMLAEIPGQQNNAGVIYSSAQNSFSLEGRSPTFLLNFRYDSSSKMLEFNLRICNRGPHKKTDMPSNVAALMLGVKHEMPQTTRGSWGPVNWSYAFNPIYNRYIACQMVQNLTIEVFLDFNQPAGSGLKSETPTDGERHVLNSLAKLFESQTLADVTFNVQNQEITGHSNILSAGSPVLAAMFQSDLEESKTRIVDIEDTSPAVFRQLLHYLYTGRVPELDNDEMTEPLFIASDKYQIESLKLLSEKCLLSKLKVTNVVRNLVLAHLHIAPKLTEACLKFIAMNNKAMWDQPEWKDLMKSYPDLFFTASHRMMCFLNSQIK